jgi:hypothetical protein
VHLLQTAKQHWELVKTSSFQGGKAQAANVLLLGPAGWGRQALPDKHINSLAKGHVSSRAQGQLWRRHLYPDHRYTFTPPGAQPQPLPVVLWDDTRGWCPDSYKSGGHLARTEGFQCNNVR